MSGPPEAYARLARPYRSASLLASALMAITCFCWGTAQLSQPGAALDLSIGKINFGDLTFAALLALLSGSARFRQHMVDFVSRCRIFVLLVTAFCVLGILSAFTNALPRDLTASDLVEMMRPAYYLIVAAVAYFFVLSGRVTLIALFLPLGIIAASANNLVGVLTGDSGANSAVLQLYNRNVVGNLLALAFVFLAVAFYFGRQRLAFLLGCAAIVLVLFSFSKGAWAMGALGVGCLAVAYMRARRKGELMKSVSVMIRLAVLAVVIVAAVNISAISKILELKAAQTFTSDTIRSQSTLALRVGHMLSSMEIVARNPLLGAGVTNFESENNLNAHWLNDIFLVNDNPHNCFFYILAGMGLPALMLFMCITIYPVLLLAKYGDWTRRESLVLGTLLFSLLFISGNFMLQLMSHYFLWLLCGVCLGLSMQRKEARHLDDAPASTQNEFTAAAEIARL